MNTTILLNQIPSFLQTYPKAYFLGLGSSLALGATAFFLAPKFISSKIYKRLHPENSTSLSIQAQQIQPIPIEKSDVKPVPDQESYPLDQNPFQEARIQSPKTDSLSIEEIPIFGPILFVLALVVEFLFQIIFPSQSLAPCEIEMQESPETVERKKQKIFQISQKAKNRIQYVEGFILSLFNPDLTKEKLDNLLLLGNKLIPTLEKIDEELIDIGEPPLLQKTKQKLEASLRKAPEEFQRNNTPTQIQRRLEQIQIDSNKMTDFSEKFLKECSDVNLTLEQMNEKIEQGSVLIEELKTLDRKKQNYKLNPVFTEMIQQLELKLNEFRTICEAVRKLDNSIKERLKKVDRLTAKDSYRAIKELNFIREEIQQQNFGHHFPAIEKIINDNKTKVISKLDSTVKNLIYSKKRKIEEVYSLLDQVNKLLVEIKSTEKGNSTNIKTLEGLAVVLDFLLESMKKQGLIPQ